jgi:hypothetical protein
MAENNALTAMDPLAGAQTGRESSLSNWAGPYVTGMLGQGRAIANQGYQGYQGPLMAGQSQLQGQAFQGLGNLSVPTGDQTSFTPQSFSDPGVTQQFMNPYLQSSLQPQMDEARRQNMIQQQQQNSGLSKAGAFGGSRQAVMNSQMDDSLLRNMANITGQGYNQAFNQAANQFNTEQGLGLQSLGQNQGYGLDVLRAQTQGGDTQRNIENQGIAADLSQFQEERDDPRRQVQFMQSLLQGLPIASQNINYAQPAPLSQFVGSVSSVGDIFQQVFGLEE